MNRAMQTVAPTQGIVTLDEGVATPVTLVVRATDVQAIAVNGEVLSLPMATVEVTPGGFDGDFIFLRAPGAPFTISTTDLSVLERMVELGGDAMAIRLQPVRKHRASASFWRNVSITVAGLLAFVLVAAMFAVPWLLSRSIDLLPTSVDRAIGDASDAPQETPITDPHIVQLAEAIVERLRATYPDSPHTYRVRVVQNEDVNAFALPGGRIVLWSGLILHAESVDQIAGVLAHEMAHVERRHGLRNAAHSVGLMLGIRLLVAMFIGDVDALTSLAADLSAFALANDFSQAQESEADRDAVLHMQEAGLDPRALASFFRMMAREDIGGASLALTWLSTHPDHAARVEAIEEEARALPEQTVRPLDASLAQAQAALR